MKAYIHEYIHDMESLAAAITKAFKCLFNIKEYIY